MIFEWRPLSPDQSVTGFTTRADAYLGERQMKARDVREAASALAVLSRARSDRKALDQFSVYSINVSNSCDAFGHLTEGIDLSGSSSGTGSVSSIGFPDDLREVMTKALHAWLESREQRAIATLNAMGVDLTDDF